MCIRDRIFSPLECKNTRAAQLCIDRLIQEDNPVDQAQFVDLQQSMNNGGGPACLRLRVVLTEAELALLGDAYRITEANAERLGNWIEEHYREELCQEGLGDPALAEESQRALVELQRLL